jgi:thiamine pyrophosphate-dependent acetolactate synthase large subunit-like protein
MMTRDECLAELNRLRGEEVAVVTCMGSAAPWSRLSDSPLDIPSVGSAMGHAADFAMGLALAQPNRPVWVLNGDGSMLMSLGTLVTVTQTPPPNLVLFVMQNDTYEVTGNQLIPGAGRISLPLLAQGAGFSSVYDFDNAQEMARDLPDILAQPGPVFVSLRIETGQEPPPSLDRPLREVVSQVRKALQGSEDS